MSNTEQMVSVSRRICHVCVSEPRDTYCSVCDDAIAQPVAQHQGEPVAWLHEDGSDAWTDEKKSDAIAHAGKPGASVAAKYTQPLYTHPAPALQKGEPVAWAETDVLDFMSVALRHAEYSGLSPSDILDGLRYMSDKGKPAFYAGEAERLREQIAKQACVFCNDSGNLMAENVKMRAQLAEAQALLREAACHAARMEPMSASCLNRIDAHLDASAGELEQGYSHEVVQRMQSKIDEQRAGLAERDALLRDLVGMDIPRTAAAIKRAKQILSVSAEPNQCDGCQAGIPLVNGAHRMGKPAGYADTMSCQAGKYASAEPSAPKCKHAACKSLGEHHPFCDFVQSIEPSAPVERDERATFEADQLSKGFAVDLLPGTVATYMIPAVRFAWAGWQARAALQRPLEQATIALGDVVRKKSGSEWEGRVVGSYSTELTPEGYCIESSSHSGSVQIYPVSALERKP